MTSDEVLLVIRPFASATCLWFASLLVATPAIAEVSCNAWNTVDFFESASAADVSRCLTAGADVNAKDGYGRQPLHHAASHSDTPAAIIPLLVNAGADVNANDRPVEGREGRLFTPPRATYLMPQQPSGPSLRQEPTSMRVLTSALALVTGIVIVLVTGKLLTAGCGDLRPCTSQRSRYGW